ncbi:hypothetical protein [Candidatus Hecatella orcuttiae]|uniref:hypothetical protein n=1 Tax=Candidatus Hecatella orcuttiae TaxID=1935119 RepID=UPI002867D4AA|nr:hypothetical protein [Candidatus Hecatella orcuttiae]
MEAELLLVLSLGFVLGLEHSADADHVVAVSTIVSKNKSLVKSSILGTLWGVGHTFTLLVAGFTVLLFKVTLSDMMRFPFEFAVGIMLVALGVSVLRRSLWDRVHFHRHTHGAQSHIHLHSHRAGESHDHKHTPLLIGMIHGLAGSAVLLLLVLSTLDSLFLGLVYILVFGVGSILGMMGLSAVISLPFILSAERSAKLNRCLRAMSGFLSIGLGILIVLKELNLVGVF